MQPYEYGERFLIFNDVADDLNAIFFSFFALPKTQTRVMRAHFTKISFSIQSFMIRWCMRVFCGV